MDAFAVAMSRSTTIRPFRVNDALKFAVFLGGIQTLMMVLGWLGGYTIKKTMFLLMVNGLPLVFWFLLEVR